MEAAQDLVKRTPPESIPETGSAESYHTVLGTSPPDYVEKISRYLGVVDQGRQDPVSQDSDSGDSLFLTQMTVPEPVRLPRRRHTFLGSDPTSPRNIKYGDDSSSAFHKEHCREKRRERIKLPIYNFPFITKRRKSRSRLLYSQQNIQLHNFGMGGFFKCVREMFQNYQVGDKVESNLRTVDMDGEEISPLSEGDEERSRDEDIKVVERKHFVVSSKGKCPHSWNTQKRDEQQRKRRVDANGITSQRRQHKTLHKTAVKACISDAERTDNGESSCRAPVETSDRDMNNGRDVAARTETPNTARRMARGSEKKAGEEKLRDDSDATSPVEKTQLDREVSLSVTADVCHIDHLSQTGQSEDGSGTRESPPHLIMDTDGGDSRVTRTKREKGGKDELHEAQHAATFENVETAGAETPAPQAGDELELNGNDQMDENTPRPEDQSVEDGVNEREEPPLKQKKKKRKKNKPAVENSGQEDESGHVECEETERKQRKEEDVEQLSSGTAAAPHNDDAEIQRRKKKRKKEKSLVNVAGASTLDQLEELESCLENAAASQETSDSSYVKRKKQEKKKHATCQDATPAGGEDGEDVSTYDDAVTPAGKKQKKQKTGFGICDGIDMFPEEVADKTPETSGDNKDVEVVTKKKKKKKKKMGEISSMTISEQSHDSVSEQEKEKKRASSFLTADAEGDKSSPSQSVAVSAGDFQTESAEMVGNVSVTGSHDGIRKKKRKRKMWADNHEQDFEELNETCQSDLSIITDAGEKRKQKREESEPATPVENAADEDVALMKKKKKKKKKKKEEGKTQDNLPTVTEDAESEISTLTSHKTNQLSSPLDPESKHGHSAESASEQITKETTDMAAPDGPGNLVFNGFRDMKKKCSDNIWLEGKSLARTVELKMKEKNSPAAVPSSRSSSSMLSETDSAPCFGASSNSIKKVKHTKAKRRLYNPHEDFFTQ
ncbi:hypothetical protein PAMA_006368 [Pampus argenteus]